MSFPRFALLLLLSPYPAGAGLKDGEVVSDGALDRGETSSALQALSLVQGTSAGSAVLNGTMPEFHLSTRAFISSDIRAETSYARARVDFADTITLEAPGVPPGTELTLRLGWTVDGTVVSSSSLFIRSLSQAMLSAGDGAQVWLQESNSFDAPAHSDPDGPVEFDFVVKEGQPEPDNILLTAAIQSVTGLPGSLYGSSYSGAPVAALGLTFIGVISVRDSKHQEIPIWTISSSSQFDYGRGEAEPTLSTPVLTIKASTAPDSSSLELRWPTSRLESYQLQSSPNGIDWLPEATVIGDDLPATVTIAKTAPRRFFRLEYGFKSSGP